MPSRVTGQALALIVLGALPSPAQPQSNTLLGAGPTFTYSRPGDRRLWGIGARLQGYPRLALVYRLRASSQFYRSGSPDPLLFTAGADFGVTVPRGAGHASFAPSLTLGPSVFYYASGRDLQTFCSSGTCTTVNQGYDPGFLLVWTATLGFEIALARRWSLVADFALHVPSGIGNNGYAGDPHAAFPGFAVGLLRSR